MAETHNPSSEKRFRVVVDDNFHYMDPSERYDGPEFSTYAEAVEWCRQCVDRSLAELYEPGMTAEKLIRQYRMFGEDPWVTPTIEGQRWSAWTYADEAAQRICGEPTE